MPCDLRAFELDPAAPPSRDESGTEHLAAKYGSSVEQAKAMQAQMTEVAAGEGLAFRVDLARGGSTFDAHRLVHLAAAHGRQDAMKERLMRAYLGEGELMRRAWEARTPAVEIVTTGEGCGADGC